MKELKDRLANRVQIREEQEMEEMAEMEREKEEERCRKEELHRHGVVRGHQWTGDIFSGIMKV